MKCDECKMGARLKEVSQARKTKAVSKDEYYRTMKEVGSRCVQCLHNGVTGMKAKVAAKAVPGFQSLDLFEPIGGF